MFEKKPIGLLSRLFDSGRWLGVGPAVPVPLPTLVMSHLITALRLDRLSFHHTTIDTAVVVRGVDKGSGLRALRDLVLDRDAVTIAIGDSPSDLSMFRAATRCFAPAQISCRRQARLLGCAVSRYPYQRGLLDIVCRLVDCGPPRDLLRGAHLSDGETLFLELLRAADLKNGRTLLRTFFNRRTLGIFVR
jgi:hypothetical protein